MGRDIAGKKREISLEGNTVMSFLPFRIGSLFNMLIKIKQQEILQKSSALPATDPDACFEEATIKAELMTQLVTLRTAFILEIIWFVQNDPEVDNKIKEDLRRKFSDVIMLYLFSLKKEEVFCFPAAWSHQSFWEWTKNSFGGHAFYVEFMCINDEWIIQIDNLGQGCNEKVPGTRLDLHATAGESVNGITQRFSHIITLPRDAIGSYLEGLIKVTSNINAFSYSNLFQDPLVTQ